MNPGDPFPPGDPLGETPLFREIQRVLLSSPGPVNWELARQVGIATASWGSEDPPPTAEDTKGLTDTVRAAELAVAEFTGLPSPPDLPDVQAVRRAQWVEANIRSIRELLEPVALKLGGALTEGGGIPGGSGTGSPFGLPLPGDAGGEGSNQAEMAAVLKANPFPKSEPKFTYAIFLDQRPPRDALEHTVGQSDEEMRLGAREIFVHYPSGMGRSKLRIPAAKTGTARNMNTIAKLAEIAAKP